MFLLSCIKHFVDKSDLNLRYFEVAFVQNYTYSHPDLYLSWYYYFPSKSPSYLVQKIEKKIPSKSPCYIVQKIENLRPKKRRIYGMILIFFSDIRFFFTKFKVRLLIDPKKTSNITKKRQISLFSQTFLGRFWHKTALSDGLTLKSCILSTVVSSF